MIVIGVDPGKHAAIAVVFGGVLVSVRKWDPDCEMFPYGPSTDLVVCGVEEPIDRPGQRKASVSNLMTLARRAGIAWCSLRDRYGSPLWVSINRWKGGLPKDVSHARIRSCLNAAELTVVGAASLDELDAAGIALYLAGRNPCRVP